MEAVVGAGAAGFLSLAKSSFNFGGGAVVDVHLAT